MRFMVLVKASKESETGVLPDEKILNEMTRFNEKLADAGVLLAGEGLQPTSKGVRIQFSQKGPVVIDGPFPETKELVAGFWIFQTESMKEAIEWARKIPFQEGEVEIRQVFEAEDFGPALTPELREAEERLRERVTKGK